MKYFDRRCDAMAAMMALTRTGFTAIAPTARYANTTPPLPEAKDIDI